jgi:hypothetical protein
MRKPLRTIFLLIAGVTGWTGLGLTAATAVSLDFYQTGDTHDLGTIYNGIPSGDANRTFYVNYLIGLGPGTGIASPVLGAGGQHYTRSFDNTIGSYPTAAFALNGSSTSINLGVLGSYGYLFAKYDGTNAGSEVWYVGNLSGTITIPADGLYEDNYHYGLSGWTLFTGGTPSVPEGGSTLMLLGSALGGIGLARRHFSR